jgi:uncharacterized protein
VVAGFHRPGSLVTRDPDRRVRVAAFVPGESTLDRPVRPPPERRVPTELPRTDVEVAVSDHPRGASVALRVVPRAPRTELVGRHGRALKLKVHAPPVEGAANEAVRHELADRVGIRASDVEVLQGERSRDKVVLLRGVTAAVVIDALAGRPRA